MAPEGQSPWQLGSTATIDRHGDLSSELRAYPIGFGVLASLVWVTWYTPFAKMNCLVAIHSVFLCVTQRFIYVCRYITTYLTIYLSILRDPPA